MIKMMMMTSLLGACVTNDEPELDSTAQEINDTCPAGVPAAIVPAADQDLAFSFPASGVQKYTCDANGAWVFVAPEALLYKGDKPVIHHYAGPTWEYRDFSSVVGAKLAGATVDASAIPWLLLNVVSHNAYEGKMSPITSIQRLSTTGGLAPAGACTPGATANVPYTALYVFYRTKTSHPERNTRCGG